MTADLGRLLDLLGRDPGERISISHLADGRFFSELATVAGAPDVAARYADGDTYSGLAPLHSRVSTGRGTAKDVIGVRALFCDLDVKPGGMASYDAAEAVIDEVSAMLGTKPVAVVRTGHGLQPYWAIERDEHTDWEDERSPQFAQAQAMFRRVGLLFAHVAGKLGGAVDTVSDLSRVGRVPGTMNCKGDPRIPVTMTETGGSAISFGRVLDTLDEYNIPDVPEDREQFADQPSDPASRASAGATCRYVKNMIAGWATDAPAARHPWLVSQCIRLAAARRNGCISESDYLAAQQALVSRFRALLGHGEARAENQGEVAGAFANAQATVAGFTDERAGKELGDHQHAEQQSLEGLIPADATAVPAPTRDVPVMTLAEAHQRFRFWLGFDYDTDALNAVLAAAVCDRLAGDPLWLLVISGPGNAKTETVQALGGAGATITSTISSPGALLSATARKEKAKDATGGLLRKLGPTGVLVIKDVTSILTMGRDIRGEVLAALREIYDGRWERNVGTDGGKTLTWTGRLVVIGAVTSAWDRAHQVISTCGDRFVLIRMDSRVGRRAAGRQAIRNTGSEQQMRAELSAAAAGVLAGAAVDTGFDLDEEMAEAVLAAADLVTTCRTGVERDYKGDVIDADMPEMPTRFAKELTQIIRGGVAIGLTPEQGLRLAIRCARDSMPPLALLVLDDIAAHPRSKTLDCRKRLGKPRSTIDRQLQALHMLGVLTLDEEESVTGGREANIWRYSVADHIDVGVIAPALREVEGATKGGQREPIPDLSVGTYTPPGGTAALASLSKSQSSLTDKSGTPFAPVSGPSAISDGVATATLGEKCGGCGWRRGQHRAGCGIAA